MPLKPISFPKQQEKIKGMILTMLPLVVAIVFLFFIPLNGMFYDDVVSLAFIHNLKYSFNLFEILSNLFYPHNEHILLTLKLFYLGDYLIFDKIDTMHMMWINLFVQILTINVIHKNLSLSFKETALISAAFISPFFFDLNYWSISLANSFVLLCSVLTIVNLAKNNSKSALVWLLIGTFSSAQIVFVIPVWVTLGIVKNKKWYLTFLPIIIPIALYANMREVNPALKVDVLSLIFNLDRFKTFLSLILPPFNLLGEIFQWTWSIIILVFSLMLFKGTTLKKSWENTLEMPLIILMLIWLVSCLLGIYMIREVMANRYLIYMSLFSSLTVITILRNPGTHVKIRQFIFWGFYLSSSLMVYQSYPKILGHHLDMRFSILNMHKNGIVPFFPSQLVYNQIDSIKVYKKTINKKFDIPSGINGNVDWHLMIFNRFIPAAFELTHKSKAINSRLELKNQRLKYQFFINNLPATGKAKFLDVTFFNVPTNTFHYAVVENQNFKFYFPCTQQEGDNQRIKLFRNFLPFGRYKVKLIKSEIGINFKNLPLN